MVNPGEVTGSNVDVIEVLRDTGVNGFSVARLRDFGRERVGLRWNGDSGNKGAPTMHGRPRWFLVPEEVAAILVDHYRGQDSAAA
ncbi:hypothetical protein GGR88_001103 [Sphingomonas jejuensis]|uniref:Uncharacterized protein n=1 Tax=Sphingomonas jejuensis TaxID=904715 RepID=A0ABX0XJW0_9SPHN|nr:hypothetical protein [Sphingomonas jejuensis]NJC33629.1 hypothetical protein [Sphingomonas jejuensis]